MKEIVKGGSVYILGYNNSPHYFSLGYYNGAGSERGVIISWDIITSLFTSAWPALLHLAMMARVKLE